MSISLKDLPYKTQSERKATDALIQTLRDHLDHTTRVGKVRARGERKKWALKDGRNPRAYDQDLPIKYAERVTVYMETKPKVRKVNHHYNMLMGYKRSIWALQSLVNELEYSIEKLRGK